MVFQREQVPSMVPLHGHEKPGGGHPPPRPARMVTEARQETIAARNNVQIQRSYFIHYYVLKMSVDMITYL